MSNEALTWAWNRVREREIPRNLIPELVAVADQANDQGVAWLLNSTLAAKTATTERTVQRNIATLASLGMIQIIERRQIGKNNRSNLYLLNMPSVDEKQRAHFVAEMTEGVIAKRREVPPRTKEIPGPPDRATPVTPRGRHPRHPLGDTDDTHNPQYEPSLKGPSSDARESKPKGKHRLPENWTAPDDLKDKLRADGYQQAQIEEQEEMFRIYWHERNDAAAQKASWKMTFLNWMKRAGKEKAGPGGPAQSHYKPNRGNYDRHQQQQSSGAGLLARLADGANENQRREPQDAIEAEYKRH